MDICEVELPNDTYTIDMEVGVNDRKYDKNEKNDEEKEAEYPDYTCPVEMEEGVNIRKYDKDEKR